MSSDIRRPKAAESRARRGGPGRPTRSDGRATRDRILAAGRELFSQQGFEATSLRAIAATAGVDLATLKYHFGDKAGLYGEIYGEGQRAFLDVLSRFFGSAGGLETREQAWLLVEGLSGELAEFLVSHEWYSRMFLYRLMERREPGAELADSMDSHVFEAIEAGLSALAARGLVRAVDSRALTLMMATGLPMLLVASRNEAGWLGEPDFRGEQGAGRLSRLVLEVLGGVLLT